MTLTPAAHEINNPMAYDAGVHTGKRFRVIYSPGCYDNDPQPIEVPLQHFTQDIGYDDTDFDEIISLSVGETYVSDAGAQSITRLD